MPKTKGSSDFIRALKTIFGDYFIAGVHAQLSGMRNSYDSKIKIKVA